MVEKGVLAKRCEVAFFAPPGFDFPGGKFKTEQLESAGAVAGYMATFIEMGDCTKASGVSQIVAIKAPDKAKDYRLYYQLSCDEGFDTGYVGFKVKVEGRDEGK